MTHLSGTTWPTATISRLFDVRGGTTPSADEGNWNGPVPWVTPVDLRPVHGGYVSGSSRTLSAAGAASVGLVPAPAGSIVLSCRAPVGYVAVSTLPVTTNQGCKSLVATTDVDARYFRYQLEVFRDALEVRGRGSTFVEISSQTVADFPVVAPTLDTQRRIADMLDAETARIDTLIEKNERVLELLEHRWQSLLENVIFGNPAVRRSPLWLACDITPGYAFRSDAFQQAGPVRLLRGVNVGVGSIDWSDVVYADEPTVAPAAEYRLKAGDLVVGMDRPWISSGLRVARIGPEDEPAYLVQRVARLRPRCGLDQDYLYLALQSRQFYAAFEPVMTGVSVPHVSGGQIGAFRIPMPDVEAQRGLEAELNASWKQAVRMRAAVDRQQALLRLRRQTLITAAVTGEIDV